jgi:hypothetical protein
MVPCTVRCCSPALRAVPSPVVGFAGWGEHRAAGFSVAAGGARGEGRTRREARVAVGGVCMEVGVRVCGIMRGMEGVAPPLAPPASRGEQPADTRRPRLTHADPRRPRRIHADPGRPTPIGADQSRAVPIHAEPCWPVVPCNVRCRSPALRALPTSVVGLAGWGEHRAAEFRWPRGALEA